MYLQTPHILTLKCCLVCSCETDISFDCTTPSLRFWIGLHPCSGPYETGQSCAGCTTKPAVMFLCRPGTRSARFGCIRTPAAPLSTGCCHDPRSRVSNAVHTRSFATSRTNLVQHVLYFGSLLGYQSPSQLSKFSRDWLDSVGVSTDVDRGLRWGSVASSNSHILMSYTLLAKSLHDSSGPRIDSTELKTAGATAEKNDRSEQRDDRARDVAEETILEDSSNLSPSSQPSKVFAIGRNTSAQLGLGFTSQEATRGMVTGDLSGTGGIKHVAAGNGFSFVVTTEADQGSNDNDGKQQQDTLFGFGNSTLGQLGLGPTSSSSSADPYDISIPSPESGLPQQLLYPLPRQIPFSEADGWSIRSLSCGMDHTLLLIERTVNGHQVQTVLSTGLNTDGQLGLTHPENEVSVPIDPLLSRKFSEVPIAQHLDKGEWITEVIAGADTSFALTSKGNLWGWGNSEYGQALNCTSKQDRIVSPKFIRDPLAGGSDSASSSSTSRIKKLVSGGSFTALLDAEGSVWVAGYGPTAANDGSDSKGLCEKLRKITFPQHERIVDLFAGLEYIVAVTDSGPISDSPSELSRQSARLQPKIYIWGVPPSSSTIGVGPLPAPELLAYSLPLTPRERFFRENPSARNKKPDLNGDCTADPDGGLSTDREPGDSQVTVHAIACNKDALLIVLEDGLEPKGVWAECIGPPKDRGTDLQ